MGGLDYRSPPIETHAREALQSIIVLIEAATRKMDGCARREAEKELAEGVKEKKKVCVREIESADPII